MEMDYTKNQIRDSEETSNCEKMNYALTSNNQTLKLLEQFYSQNSSNLNESVELGQQDSLKLKYGLEATIALSLAYATVFVAGIIGNVVVLFIVKRTPRMRTLTNQFISNLAAADLLVIFFCIPFTLVANIFPAWILGAVSCKLVPYLQGVSVAASVNTLMAISIDRCMAISCPLLPTKSKRYYTKIMFAIWMVALTINLPWLYVFQLVPSERGGYEVCSEVWPSPLQERIFFTVANLIICYLAPLVVISACYILIWTKVKQRSVPGVYNFQQNAINSMNKSRLKVAKMVFVVILTFAISWAPLYSIFIAVKFCDEFPSNGNVRIAFEIIIPIAQWLGLSNSCTNPILFVYLNRRFRISFQKIIRKVFWSKCFTKENEIHLRNFSSGRPLNGFNGRTISLKIYNN